MSTATTEPTAINGVDVPTLFATLDAVRGQRELASRGYYGAGQEHEHQRTFVLDADHPPVLVGGDNGPAPVEYLLYALSACITAGIGNIASARGVALTSVETTVVGDIDLQGLLGMSDTVRNGYEGIAFHVTIEGDAPAETLQRIVEQSRARSAVYDVLTNGVPVTFHTTA